MDEKKKFLTQQYAQWTTKREKKKRVRISEKDPVYDIGIRNIKALLIRTN